MGLLSRDHFQIDENGSAIMDGDLTVRGFVRVVGAQKVRVTSTAVTSYTVVSTDRVVMLSAVAARAAVLPDATTVAAQGRMITIADTANTTAAISVTAAAGNVAGGTTATQNTALGSKTYCSNGTDWFAVA